MNLPDFTSFRQEIHENPELSGQEKETRQRVLNFLEPTNPDKVLKLKTSNGLLFFYGTPDSGKQIMVRCELDALPILETNEDLSYKSKKKNVSHKCGHDGHMAILSRLAYLLSEQRPQKGCVILLFQPAEENGKGAKAVYEDKDFQKLKVDAIVSLHNVPGYPSSSILLKSGAFTPAVCSLIIRFKGKTSHAAEPENGLNPAKIMAQYTLKAINLNEPNHKSDDFLIITPVYQVLGSPDYGISAGYGEVHLTIRCWQNKLLYDTMDELEQFAKDLAESSGMSIEKEYRDEFMANQNDTEMVEIMKKAAQKLNLEVINLPTPMPWGEDFGLFTEHYKGAMFGLGSGKDQPALHNPDYDFPDELIEPAAHQFFEIVKIFLNV